MPVVPLWGLEGPYELGPDGYHVPTPISPQTHVPLLNEGQEKHLHCPWVSCPNLRQKGNVKGTATSAPNVLNIWSGAGEWLAPPSFPLLSYFCGQPEVGMASAARPSEMPSKGRCKCVNSPFPALRSLPRRRAAIVFAGWVEEEGRKTQDEKGGGARAQKSLSGGR